MMTPFVLVSTLSLTSPRKRIDLAGDSLRAEPDSRHIDTGFRAFTLGDTNLSKWKASSDIEADGLQQHLLDLRDSADDRRHPRFAPDRTLA